MYSPITEKACANEISTMTCLRYRVGFYKRDECNCSPVCTCVFSTASLFVWHSGVTLRQRPLVLVENLDLETHPLTTERAEQKGPVLFCVDTSFARFSKVVLASHAGMSLSLCPSQHV
jgi:hypothetical protein